MITIQNYVRAESLEQAYELNQKKSARILGGMLWLKMAKTPSARPLISAGWGLTPLKKPAKGSPSAQWSRCASWSSTRG